MAEGSRTAGKTAGWGAGSKRRQAGLALKLVVGAVALIGLGSAGVAAFSWTGADTVQRADHYVVGAQSFDIFATGNGELRARKQTTLRSDLEQQAAIVEIVDEGSFVKKGDVIVRLNADDIQRRLDDDLLQLESARSDLVSADNAYQIQVSDNESAMRQAKLKLEIAELELRKWQEGEVVEKRAGLKLDRERAEREHERLHAKVERARMLFEREFLSKDELDKDEVAYIEAVSKLETTNLAIQVYEEFTYSKDLKQKTSDVEEAVAELERVQRKNESELASKEAQFTNRKRQLQLREERVNKLREQLAACTIRAPTAGLVVYATSLNQNSWSNDNGAFEVGSDIRPNQEIIALPDTSEMIATVRIPEALLSRVRAGQRCTLTIDAAQGKTYTGVVDSIGVMAQSAGWRDPNVREYEVRIALDLGSEPHKLKPSMRCEARIILDVVNEAIAVPIQAVFNEGRRQFVYQQSGSKYAMTDVRVGRRSDAFAEILSGLSGGETVLLRQPDAGAIIASEAPELMAAKDQPTASPAGAKRQRGQRAAGGPRAGQGPEAKPATPAPAAPVKAAETSAADADDLDDSELDDEDLDLDVGDDDDADVDDSGDTESAASEATQD